MLNNIIMQKNHNHIKQILPEINVHWNCDYFQSPKQNKKFQKIKIIPKSVMKTVFIAFYQMINDITTNWLIFYLYKSCKYIWNIKCERMCTFIFPY